MRVIARKTLKDFWIIYPQSEQALKSWYTEISHYIFGSPQQIIRFYPRASVLEHNRIVFRIKGNDYRIIAKINYDHQILWIRFIGTHQEYDKIDARNI